MKYVFGITPSGEPRREISYSGWSLWLKNPELYRAKYYRNEPQRESPEMFFGKEIAERLEANDPMLAHVPRYSHPEFRIQVKIAGVPVQGYLDSFDPVTCSILEYKTSKNSETWNSVSVAKHEQLPFYLLLVKTKFGKADRRVKLIRLGTKYEEKTSLLNGQKVILEKPKLVLTGEMEIFPRIVWFYEAKRIKKSIRKVAKEIHEDFQNYKKTNEIK